MIPKKTIEELINKHLILEKDLSSGKVDKKSFAEKSKEYSDLNEVIENARKYLLFETDKKELEKILDDQTADKELKKMAETELNDLRLEYEINEKKLKSFVKKHEIKKCSNKLINNLLELTGRCYGYKIAIKKSSYYRN